MRYFFQFLVLILFVSNANAGTKHLHTERFYQEQDCKGILEFKFDDGTRADCLENEYVSEYDYAYKFYESVGQALYYSMKSGLKPRIVLIVDKKQYEKYIEKATPLCKRYGIKLDVIKDYQ